MALAGWSSPIGGPHPRLANSSVGDLRGGSKAVCWGGIFLAHAASLRQTFYFARRKFRGFLHSFRTITPQRLWFIGLPPTPPQFQPFPKNPSEWPGPVRTSFHRPNSMRLARALRRRPRAAHSTRELSKSYTLRRQVTYWPTPRASPEAP
jgi:hypothetical protein